MEATAMASSPPPRRGTILSILPPELLVDVLSLVSPQDVASFAQTCHDADSLVYGTGSATDNLWRRLFLDRCDKPSRVPPPVDDTTISSSASVPSYMRSSLKALSRARTDLRHGARRQPVLASSHGRTLRTLVNAMESRALRRPSSSLPNPNDDIPPSLTAATLASMFPANYVGDQRWAAFVYPREKVKALSRWQEEAKLGRQRKLKMQEEKARKTEAAMAKKKAKTKAGNSKDTAAGSEEATAAAAVASSSSTTALPAATSSTSPSQAASSKKRRRASSHAGQEGNASEPRRSARIQRRVAAAARDVYVPSELLDFLEEAHDRRKSQSTATTKKAQAGPSTAIEPADDDDVVSRLESLAAALDEEAAAQLHVLHGVRLMRMPTEDEKQRLVAKARRRKRKEIEEMAKERKKAKAAATANGSKGKGKEVAMESDADDTDVQASSQGNENVKGKGASKSKKPSSTKVTAARRRRVRKAMNESDEDEPLLQRGYESQDGDDYAQYPSVMSAQNAPALPLPAVTIPAYGQLPRLYSSAGKGTYHEPRLFDGPSDDERDKRDNANEDNDTDVESLNSDARMDEFFEFRMMVDEAYHDGYFDSREHRDAVIQGRASPPPHIDDEMQRIHDRLKRGKSLDDPPSDDDADAQDYGSDASYTSPPPPSMTPTDFSDDWTPGLDFDTEHSVHQVNSFLGASKGPGGDAILRREAKELVYDAGRYAFENAWGPFMPFRSGGRGGGRRAIGPWEMMQLGLQDDDDEDEDEEDNEQIEEVVDMETLDAQAAAQGITWQPGQDESDDSGTPAPANNAAAQAIADYPAATTTTANTAAAPAPASDLAPTTTDDEDFESDDALSSGPSMSGSGDDSDDDAMHFGGVGPTDFARMVQRVGSYAGVKVRNRFEDEEKERKSTDIAGQAPSPRRVKVDWLLAEAIMIVVHANLHHAIHRRGWGSGFILPRGARGDDERTLKDAGWWRGGPGPLDDCSHKRNRRLLYPHAGWAMSRGEERPRELPVQKDDDDDDDDADDDDKAEASSAAKDSTAPAVKDWANVESATWMGTYFFLDYPHFLRYNSRLASEGSDGQRTSTSAKSGTNSETGAASELLNRSEATGDCLALRLTLRPPNRQAAEHEEGDQEAATYGPDDPEFPTLRFSGRTYTFMSLDDAARLREQQQMAAGSDDENDDDDMMNEDLSEDEHGGPILPPPTARGHAHGFVRPVYSEDPTQQRARYHAASGKWLPLIVAIQWRVTHAYEGADRWSLSGVQAGTPGTRAPIYGTWSDVERDDGSPLGPFAYFNVDSRPWAEVERLRQEEVERKERAIQARRQKVRDARRQRLVEEAQQQGQGQQAGGATTAAAVAA